MRTLPTGTVTYLFTDVEGSVQIWEQDPAAMREAMRRHDALVEECVGQHGGCVVRPRGEGDSRFAVFMRATNAVAAACALQRALGAESWVTPRPVRVRMALHTGEGDFRAGDYYGPAVNRCARLRGVAHGGQALLTLATAELVRDGLPEGAKLRPLGIHRLRDLQRPEEIFQILDRDLPDEFPPLKSVDIWPNNLPVQLTSFVGREKEIAEVKRALASARLVMLTGAGGCGKTRLALQVAVEAQEEYPDGVWLAELAAMADPALVPQALATALAVREEPHRTLTDTLVEYLRPKQMLLVIDNCEHLVEACAQMVGTLLRACPKIRVLATSREVLGITGEMAWRVPSLRLPDPQRLPPTETLTEYEAVRLFSERAGTVAPGFRVTNENASVVVQVCQRLDGIPLAIELAAARVKVLSEEQIAQRLDDRFRLLTGGSRTALPRHQTLRATMDWSYDLITELERGLLRRLAVFVGGFTLEAAEAIGAGDGVRDRDVLDLLVRLVDKSLVLVDEQDEKMRYRLLETMRQYAWAKLVEVGETEVVRERHRVFFLKLAERAEPEWSAANQAAWLDCLEVEHGNLTAALEWSLERAPEAGLQFAAAVWRFWEMRGHLSEGRQWLEGLLRAAGERASAAVRAKALNGAGAMAQVQGDHPRAVALFEEALALWRQLGDRLGVSKALNNLGIVICKDGDYARARSYFEQSLAIKRELGDKGGVAISLGNLAFAVLSQGDYTVARSYLEQSLAIGREVGDKGSIAITLNNLALVMVNQGDHSAAHAFLEESLAIKRELGDTRGITASLEEFARVAAAQGQIERAARMYGAAEGLREQIGARTPVSDRAHYDRSVAEVRAAIGEERFAAAWAQGRATTLEQAIAYILEEPEEGDQQQGGGTARTRSLPFPVEDSSSR